MPLSMTLNRLNDIPSVTPCLNGKELRVDSELINAGLSAISVKGYDAGDRRGEASLKHRNSFWSVHRPELAKLSWAANHPPEKIENYLKFHAESQYSHEKFEKKSDIPPADFNELTVIHATLDRRLDTDENHFQTSKPQTIQLSDEDLASHTTLHKSRAEFCVTIGRMRERVISDTLEPCSTRTIEEKNAWIKK